MDYFKYLGRELKRFTKTSWQRFARKKKIRIPNSGKTAALVVLFAVLWLCSIGCAHVKEVVNDPKIKKAWESRKNHEAQKLASKIWKGDIDFCNEMRKKMEGKVEKKWFGLKNDRVFEKIDEKERKHYEDVCR